MTITQILDTVEVALRQGASPNIIKLALMSDGVPANRADTIIAWARLQIERGSNDEERLYQGG